MERYDCDGCGVTVEVEDGMGAELTLVLCSDCNHGHPIPSVQRVIKEVCNEVSD